MGLTNFGGQRHAVLEQQRHDAGVQLTGGDHDGWLPASWTAGHKIVEMGQRGA
jgi:hypothetical protein